MRWGRSGISLALSVFIFCSHALQWPTEPIGYSYPISHPPPPIRAALAGSTTSKREQVGIAKRREHSTQHSQPRANHATHFTPRTTWMQAMQWEPHTDYLSLHLNGLPFCLPFLLQREQHFVHKQMQTQTQPSKHAVHTAESGDASPLQARQHHFLSSKSRFQRPPPISPSFSQGKNNHENKKQKKGKGGQL